LAGGVSFVGEGVGVTATFGVEYVSCVGRVVREQEATENINKIGIKKAGRSIAIPVRRSRELQVPISTK
jgi:hypothetical protein